MKKSIIFIFLVSIISLGALNPNDFSLFPQNNLLEDFHLNPNDFQINHSISTTTMVSSSNSFYQSMYTNHINYQLNENLNLKIDLNFVNYGSFNIDNNFDIEGNNDNQSKFLPEFRLEYSPTDNMKIKIEYRNSATINRNRNWNY